MKIRSRSPLRISFSGGGTDIEEYFSLPEKKSLVINATISKYATAVLEPRDDFLITVKSHDYDTDIQYSSCDKAEYDNNIDIPKAIHNYLRRLEILPEQPKGYNLHIHCDAPPGSGLGSSSCIVSACIGAILYYYNLYHFYNNYAIAQFAYNIERKELDIKGGAQDQYATVFGGINLLEFTNRYAFVNRIQLDNEFLNELELSIIQCYVGGSRDSDKIMREQKKNVKVNEEYLDNMVIITEQMYYMLISGDVKGFAGKMLESWELKKNFSKHVANDIINEACDVAMGRGAISTKISGAGSGGFLLIMADPCDRAPIIKGLQDIGGNVIDCSFSNSGLQAWHIL